MEPLPPSERLAAVLAVACAPPHPDEFAGEDAALAAFRDRPARRRFSLRRAIGVKITVILTMTVAAGGVAVAKILPNPFDVTVGAEPLPPAQPPPRPLAEPPMRSEVTASPAQRGPAPRGGADHGPLCRQFVAKTRDDRSRALQTAEFAPLVAVAGAGLEQVGAFCANLAERPVSSPPPQAVPPNDDRNGNGDNGNSVGGQPGNQPGGQPGGQPSGQPGGHYGGMWQGPSGNTWGNPWQGWAGGTTGRTGWPRGADPGRSQPTLPGGMPG